MHSGAVVVFQSTGDYNRPYMWAMRRKGFGGQSVLRVEAHGRVIFMDCVFANIGICATLIS